MSAQRAVRKDMREDVILLGDKKKKISQHGCTLGNVHSRFWRMMRSQSSQGQRREARSGQDIEPEAFNEVTYLGGRRMTLSSCNMCAMIGESENRASRLSEMKLKLLVFMDVVWLSVLPSVWFHTRAWSCFTFFSFPCVPVTQSCWTLCDPMVCSQQGSPMPSLIIRCGVPGSLNCNFRKWVTTWVLVPSIVPGTCGHSNFVKCVNNPINESQLIITNILFSSVHISGNFSCFHGFASMICCTELRRQRNWAYM